MFTVGLSTIPLDHKNEVQKIKTRDRKGVDKELMVGLTASLLL